MERLAAVGVVGTGGAAADGATGMGVVMGAVCAWSCAMPVRSRASESRPVVAVPVFVRFASVCGM